VRRIPPGMNLLQRYEEANRRSMAASFVGTGEEALKPNLADLSGNMGIAGKKIQHLVHAEMKRMEGSPSGAARNRMQAGGTIETFGLFHFGRAGV
jgi:hypothetical protein